MTTPSETHADRETEAAIRKRIAQEAGWRAGVLFALRRQLRALGGDV